MEEKLKFDRKDGYLIADIPGSKPVKLLVDRTFGEVREFMRLVGQTDDEKAAAEQMLTGEGLPVDVLETVDRLSVKYAVPVLYAWADAVAEIMGDSMGEVQAS